MVARSIWRCCYLLKRSSRVTGVRPTAILDFLPIEVVFTAATDHPKTIIPGEFVSNSLST